MADDINLLQEIDDSMRVENLERFWKENGKVVLGGCVLVVILTIAMGLWKNHMHEAHRKETDLLLRADKLASAGKIEEATPLFEAAEKGSPGIAALAKIRQAEMLSDAGKNDKAIVLYKEVASDRSRSFDEGLRDLALMRAEILEDNITHGHAVFDKNPAFDAIVGEVAAVQFMKVGKNAEARQILTNITQNPTLGKSERMRAYELLSALPSEDKK